MPLDRVALRVPPLAEMVRLPFWVRTAEIATSRLVEPVVVSVVPSFSTGQAVARLGSFENRPIKLTSTCFPAGTSTVWIIVLDVVISLPETSTDSTPPAKFTDDFSGDSHYDLLEFYGSVTNMKCCVDRVSAPG